MADQPRKDNPARGIRIPDELWHAAQTRAAERGEDVSKPVRRFLEEYVTNVDTEAVDQRERMSDLLHTLGGDGVDSDDVRQMDAILAEVWEQGRTTANHVAAWAIGGQRYGRPDDTNPYKR